MLISDAEGQALLQEYYNRLYEKELKHQDSQIDFIDPVFAIQNEVISDWENRYKANQCTRRAGKSYTEVIDHCNVMDKFSNSRNLYLGLTAESAPLDSDDDGIPDSWEDSHGLSNLQDDHNTIMNSGYTAIEEYINELADDLLIQ